MSAHRFSPQYWEIVVICLVIISGVFILGALHWLQPVVVPLVLAAFISLLISPVIDVQVLRYKLPRMIAITTTMVLLIAACLAMMAVTFYSMNSVVKNLNKYQERLDGHMASISHTWLIESMGMTEENLKGLIPYDKISAGVEGLQDTMLGGMGTLILILIMVGFLQVGRQVAQTRGGVLGEMETKVKRFIIAKTLVSVFTAFCVGVFLWIIGMDGVLVLTFFVFFLNFIPSIGSIIATLLPLPLLLVEENVSVVKIFLALVIPGVFQFTLGNVVEPKIYGEALDLHPITLLLSLIFWGMLWGPAGVFLAIPLTASLKIILENIEPARPFAELLAGRTEAIERFGHRNEPTPTPPVEANGARPLPPKPTPPQDPDAGRPEQA